MKTLLRIIGCFISFVFSILVIVALQYGYEFGPKWLFRYNDQLSLFVILTGTSSISFSFIVCMFLLSFEDDEDEYKDDEDDSDWGYSEDKV